VRSTDCRPLWRRIFLRSEQQTSVSSIAADGYADFSSGGTKLKRN
jgi:hypothetical protein